jgi:predicted transglutaminase-like protease
LVLEVKRVSYPVFELDGVSSIRDIKLHLKKELQYKKVGQLEKIILVQRRMTSVSTDSHTSLS